MVAIRDVSRKPRSFFWYAANMGTICRPSPSFSTRTKEDTDVLRRWECPCWRKLSLPVVSSMNMVYLEYMALAHSTALRDRVVSGAEDTQIQYLRTLGSSMLSRSRLSWIFS